MPKKIDPKVKERCVRQVLEHLPYAVEQSGSTQSFAALSTGTFRESADKHRVHGPGRQGSVPH